MFLILPSLRPVSERNHALTCGTFRASRTCLSLLECLLLHSDSTRPSSSLQQNDADKRLRSAYQPQSPAQLGALVTSHVHRSFSANVAPAKPHTLASLSRHFPRKSVALGSTTNIEHKTPATTRHTHTPRD